MKFKKTIFILIIAVFLISIAGVCASDVNDEAVASQNFTTIESTQTDENEEISLPDESQVVGQTDNQEMISADVKGTFAALEREIQNGYNSNITLKNDYAYEGSGYEDGITISQSITIDGNGSTIDAKGQARIFNIRADNVVIKNITFINAKSTYDSGAVSWDGVCGSLSGCRFVNNSAEGFGGAVVWLVENGTVSDCSFVNNSANCGGAVWWDGADGVVSGCSFVNNSANGDSGGAGAIYWNDAPRGVICDCSFVDNSASVYGGALFWDRESYDSIVSGCSFVNSSAGDGAAIYWGSGTNSNISGCIFVNNSAYNAVIYISSKYLSVNDNIFLNNNAVAIYSDVYNDDANRDYNWFGHNATNYMDNPGVEGCNVWLFLDTTAIPNLISLSDSFDVTFKLSAYNSVEVSEYDNGRLKDVELTLAPTIGNVNVSRTNPGKSVQYIADGVGTGKLTATVENAECSIPLTITDGTTFSDLNQAINGNDTIVLDRDYAYNSTVDSGFNNGIVISRAVTIIGNGHSINAAGRARIFNVQANDVVINNVTFINAKTTGEGGAVVWNGANGMASDCSFVNNSANSGGAICYYRSTNCSVSYSSFIGNSAIYGGAIDNTLADNCSVFYCNFENNSVKEAQNAGGVISWNGNGGVVSGCSFVNSSAKCGGVMYWTRDNGNVSGCLFVNNSADEGIIYLYNGNHGKNFSVNDNIFLNNDGVAIYFYEMDSGSNADYNWFGHNATNYNIRPTTTANVEINTWLFLTATSTPNALYLSDSFDVVFRLCAYNSSGISEYDNGRLKEVNLTLTPINGRINTTRTNLERPVRYYSEGPGGKLTATAEDAVYTIQITSEVTSFSELNSVINGVTIDTITLDKDFKYNSTTDGHFKNGIIISRPLTIIGNGHVIDGAGQAEIFYIQSHDVVLKNITFTNARANDGGAIFWQYDGNANISDCVFVNNSATKGGAIMLCGPNSAVSGCIFVNNSASMGGAIYWNWLSDGVVSGCAFLNNSADDGIIYFQNSNYDDVHNLAINDNIFLNCNGAAISFYRSVSGSNADYNWFGHNATNYNVNPNLPSCTVWLFLNATATSDTLGPLETSEIIFKLYAYDSNSQGVAEYDNALFNNINLTVTSTGGSVDKRVAKLNETIKFTPTESGIATVTVQFKNVEQKFDIDVTLHDASVSVNNSTLDLKIDDTFTIVATPDPANLNVTFVPDDSGVVSVDENGFVTALKGGTATIVVKVGGDGNYTENSTTVTVTVSKVFTEIILENDNFTLNALENISAGATLNPAVAGNLTYTSNDTSVAIVENGVIKALAEGTATITVSFAGNEYYAAAQNKTINVVVKLNGTSVTVNNSTLDLKIGDTFTIVATTVPDGLDVTFVPDNSGVVSVDENGVVTALKAGTANIVVKVEGDDHYAESSTNVIVTVSKVFTEIILENDNFELNALENISAGATLNPASAGNLNYVSNDTSVARVYDGEIITVGAGTALITVSFAGDDTYAAAENKTIKITVTAIDASVNVDEKLYMLNIGEVVKIGATSIPEDLAISYEIYGDCISINEYGYVTALGEGTAFVLVSVGDDVMYKYDVVSVSVIVIKTPTEIIVQNTTLDMKVGEEADPAASLMPSAAGNLTYTSNDTSVVIVENGVIKALAAGTATITVSFAGNELYDAAENQTINVTVRLNAPPVFALSENKNVAALYSAKANYKVLVTRDGKAVGAGETVTIKYNGKTYNVKTDKNGYATLKLKTNVKVKAYTITAEYKGVKVTNKVTIKNIIKAKNKKVKKSKKVTKVKVSLKKVNGKYLKGKVLKIKFNKKTYKVKTNKKGAATWKVKKSMIKKLKVGKKYKYKVTYGKDVVTKKLTIKK